MIIWIGKRKKVEFLFIWLNSGRERSSVCAQLITNPVKSIKMNSSYFYLWNIQGIRDTEQSSF